MTKPRASNAATDTYENLVKAGVNRPDQGVRTALQDAASSRRPADHHLKRRSSRKPEDKGSAPAMPDMGGMGGMGF